jgi:hypothetical protein
MTTIEASDLKVGHTIIGDGHREWADPLTVEAITKVTPQSITFRASTPKAGRRVIAVSVFADLTIR